MKIKLLSLVFAHNEWSWGLTAGAVHECLKAEFDVTVQEAREWAKCPTESDIILSQNITQFRWFTRFDNIIARLGGNMSFDEKNVVQEYLKNMNACYGIIATNQKLKDIASTVNANVHLIPNGINLDVWCPNPERKWRYKKPVIGFVGNIGTPRHSEYKGHPLVKEACETLKLTLHEALYKTKQVPHDQMKADFWDKIDILVLPTAGEGCSNTIMEALACGVPVITTKVAGFHGECLTNGQDVIFCDRTVDSIIYAIQAFRADKTLFKTLSENGRRFAEEHHDIKSIAEQYRKLFLECYNDATTRSSN